MQEVDRNCIAIPVADGNAARARTTPDKHYGMLHNAMRKATQHVVPHVKKAAANE